MEERRAARRYNLTLQIEIRLESNLKEFEPILGRTRDISTHGFYYQSDQGFSVGMKFWFSILPPWEVAQGSHAFISGRARAVRVEEVSESDVYRVGIGAMIERYKFGQTESSAYLTGSGSWEQSCVAGSSFFLRGISKTVVMLITLGGAGWERGSGCSESFVRKCCLDNSEKRCNMTFRDPKPPTAFLQETKS